MKYTKPMIIAQSKKNGSFAAGCPAKDCAPCDPARCKYCERTA